MIKKQYLIFYFTLFILLNIFDFLNMLPNDIDFFKKLLSWSIISYLFYSISFTKLFIGTRYKKYDIAFLCAYLLLTLPKIIIHYVQPFSSNNIPFIIFKPIIFFLTKITENHMIIVSVLSMVIIIGISTIIFRNKSILPKSFVGTINYNNLLLNKIIQLSLLYFISLFFGLMVFNFFIEWFALAVDSVILVLGLMYYIFNFIKNHTNTASSQLLWTISNTGNDFYKEIVELFSQRKTFFIGISFFLVIHLLVDVGVYLVPYGVGTQNSLYFESLNTFERQHTPLFSIFDPSSSQMGEDVKKITSKTNITSTIFLTFSLFAIYILHFIAFLFLLILPFLIYYYNIKKKELKIPPYLLQLLLLSTLFVLIFYLFYSNGFNPPLNIGLTYDNQIQGVDIYTSQIIKVNYENLAVELVSVLLIIITLYGFLNYGCYRYYNYLEKTAYLAILLFFILYISFYYFSYLNIDLIPNTYQYNSINTLYQDKNTFKGEEVKFSTSKATIFLTPFTNTSTNNLSHNNYESYIAINVTSKDQIPFSNDEDLYIKENNNNNNTYNYYGYYSIGENEFNETNEYGIIKRNELGEYFNTLQRRSDKDMYEIGNDILTFVRYIFLTIFYLLGLIYYSREFLRENIFS